MVGFDGRRGRHWLRRHQAAAGTSVSGESVPWKDELLKVADRLEAKTKQTRWTDRTGYLIERDFAVSAYAMRKLIESHQHELSQRQFPVRRFDQLRDSYDFDNGRRKTLSVEDLCHEIVHSSTFEFCCGETADLFDGVYVSSDHRNNSYVYLVLVSDYTALCEDVAMSTSEVKV
jgi:hypothetical protein